MRCFKLLWVKNQNSIAIKALFLKKEQKQSLDASPGSTGVRLFFLILSFLYVIYFLWTSDRDNVIDNKDYIDYFSAPGLDRLADFWEGIKQGGLKGFASLFTEELFWWCWIVLLSGLDPLTAVRFTTVCISILIFAACLTYRNSLLAWMLWLVHPLAFSVVGYYQIRQGFALSIYLAFGAVFGRYGLGLVFAALVHTTFLIPLLLYIAPRAFSLPLNLKMIIVVLAGVTLPIILAQAFESFGGRRTTEFSVSEGTTSLTFVIGICVFLLLPTFLLSRKNLKRMIPFLPTEFILNYAGLLVFLLSSFFFFPLGTSRMLYYSWLFAIPIVGSLDYQFSLSRNLAGVTLSAILFFLLMSFFYIFLKYYLISRYFCFDLACTDI